MADDRLIHDAAWATTTSIVECLGQRLSEDEQQQMFGEVYQQVRAGIEAFCIQQTRMRRRLGPSRN